MGAGLVIFGAILAYVSYNTYKPVLPQANTLDEAITRTAYELINLAIRLGFLGIMIGAGAILLKYGIRYLSVGRSTRAEIEN